MSTRFSAIDHVAQQAATPRLIPWYFAWMTAPVLLTGAILAILSVRSQGWNYATVTGIVIVTSALILVAMELRYPLDARWQMTWRSFGRDLKYFVTSGITIGLTNAAFAVLGVTLAKGHQGMASDWKLIHAVPIGLFTVDFLQYWQHRFSHAAKGRLGAWYWRVHVAHHLPDKVYVAMHPAGHPINGFVVRGLVTIVPLYALGFSIDAVALINIIIGVIGLLSHTNIGLRAGLLNYVVTGSELHRYHHSADPTEVGNYAIALSLIDVMFGTFRYRPGVPPANLGVENPVAYPASDELFKVLKLPFARRVW